MLDRILVAVNDNDYAKRAAAYGFELAGTYGASVDALHVLEAGSNADRESANELGTALLEGIATDPPGEVEAHLLEGRPASVIVDFAHDNDLDLVVMGNKGRTGVGERLLGNVTERVLRRTHVPVLAVWGDDHDAEIGDYTDVLVTTDGSEIAERAAPYAGDLAERYGATLHVLTAVDVHAEAGPFDAGGLTEEFIEQLESQGREALDRFDDALGEVDVERRRSVERGTPHECIDEYADENDVDLLVIASEGQNNLVGQRLGSVTTRVLNTVDVPVLVVPTPS